MRTMSAAAALWLALPAMAMAQGGGYPASPSHAVVGATPDGAPRYGHEPSRQTGRSPATVGRGGAGQTNQTGQGSRASSSTDESEGTRKSDER
jgi:hypothetical protein